MPSIQVSIVRFIDEHQPGFVEAEFADADGTLHTLVDKVPDPWRLPKPPPTKAEPQAITLSENDHKTTQLKLEKPQE